MIYIINFVSVLLDFSIIKLLFNKLFVYNQHNSHFKIYDFILIVCFYISNVINNFQGNILTSVLFILLLSLKYKMPYYKRIVSILLLFIGMGIIEIFTTFITGLLFNIDIQLISTNIFLYTFAVLLSKVLTYVIVYIWNFDNHKLHYLDYKIELTILLLSTTIISVTFYFISRIIFVSNNTDTKMIGLALIILLTIFYLVVLEAYNWYSQAIISKEELNLLSQQMEFQKKYHQQILENNKNIRKIRHDLKNNIAGILGLIDENEVDKARNYALEIIDNVTVNANTYTGNYYIDAIISYKKEIAKKSNVNFNITVNSFFLGNIDEKYLGILLGCAMDNAIEATKEEEKKFVEIYIKVNGQYLCIKMINSCTKTNINFHKSSKLSSIDQHGFGVKNIETICNMYNGSYTYQNNDDSITLNIILQLQ